MRPLTSPPLGARWAATALTSLLAMAGASLGACDSESDPAGEVPDLPTIATLASATETLSSLNTALAAAGLVDTFDDADGGPYTVFAPTDAAFGDVDADTLAALLADPEALATVLQGHVVEGRLDATEVAARTEVTTLSGTVLPVTVNGATITVGGATVAQANIEASNGVVHLIDTVILPPDDPDPAPQTIIDVAAADGGFTTLLTAVDAAGLTDTLSGTAEYTVFAPTDAAFAALPDGALEGLLADTDALRDVLLFHVVEGSVTASTVAGLSTVTTLSGQDAPISVDGDGNVFVAGAQVTVTDLEASNGIIHVVDAVLLPEEPAVPNTLLDEVQGNPDLSTLATAIDVAGLEGSLSGETVYTLFAPTNAAFAALPEGALDALLADAAALEQVLLTHLVAGEVTSEIVVNLDSATTAAGIELTVSVQDERIFIGDAEVVLADIQASNGVMHVIDAVLLPPVEPEMPTIAELATDAGDFTTLLAAVEAAGLTATLSDPDQQLTVFAPTDAAFAALPEGTVEALLADIPALTNLLQYHIVAGVVTSDIVVTLETASTLNGQVVTISVDADGSVFINDAQVVVVDLMASNGVVHVIDAVLQPPQPPAPTIADIAIADGGFTTLLAAVEAAGLTATLADPEQQLTVFAPTDAAFAALPEGTVEALLADIPALTDILQYHIVPGVVTSDIVVTLNSATTLLGESVTITVDGEGNVFVNDAQVIVVDLVASNGVVHVVDAVLLPAVEPPAPTIAEIALADGGFTTLLAAVEAAGLTATLADPEQDLTVFAPTDAAFAALPEGAVEALLADIPALTNILQYHIVAGSVTGDIVITLESATTLQGEDVTITVDGDGDVFINDAQVIVVDLIASNGVVHVIDTVLIPPSQVPMPTIAELATEAGGFTTLLAAVEAAGLTETLADPEQELTVFAPTDAAFAALPEGTVEALLADIPALTEVLQYHIVAGVVTSDVVVTLDSATTLLGEDVTVTVDGDGNVFVNDAQVVIVDLMASNGVVHVIDAVLTPPLPTIAEIAAEDGGFATLLAAVEAASLTETLADPEQELTVFAPTDAAFAALPDGTFEALLADIPALTNILQYHIVAGTVTADVVVTLESATTLSGDDVTITVDGSGDVFVNDAQVIVTDILASNGVVHVIDTVLIPELPTVAELATEAGDFTTLLAAVEAAGLTETLADPEQELTVFAPTDAAFAALPEGTVEALLADIPTLTTILQYHIVAGLVPSAMVLTMPTIETLSGESITVTVDGGFVFIDGAQLTAIDLEASNGIVHVLDAVLTPPSLQPPPTIAELAVEAGDFTTLLAAVDAAGLTETLADPEQELTVFAPTDAAFAALPEGTVAALLDDIPALTEILTYHIVAGTQLAADVASVPTLTTLQGEDVTITVDGSGNVFIDDAQILVVDLVASNGVVHVIDAVLTPPEPLPTIADIAAGAGNFSTLLAAVDAAGLTDTLADPAQDLTVFAPTDDAFAALPEGTVEALLADTPTLTAILQYHLVAGSVFSDTAVTLDTATTLNGADVNITVVGTTVFINDAMVTVVDLQASNGVVHVIDTVLLPDGETMPTIADIGMADGGFDTLMAAVDAAGLTETFDDPTQELTVFAPTDAAFAALPEGTLEALLADIPALTDILTYHVVPGAVTSDLVVTLDSATTLLGEDVTLTVDDDGDVFVNGAQVIITDIMASNGIIHVIDAVLLPPEPTTIVSAAEADGNFTTLLAALDAAGLTGVLEGDGPFTVFAPTDAAFAALDPAALDALLADPDGALTDVLLYHVVDETLAAGDVVGSETLDMLSGLFTSVSVNGSGDVFINDAQVIITDIATDNGVIHVIDTVLVPPGTVADIVAGNTDFSTLLTALEATGLDAALAGDGPFTVFAPTDAAFAAMDPEVLNAALADPAGLLTEVLLLHVVADLLTASQVASASSVPTVQGSDAAITVDGSGGVFIEGAQVVVTNVPAANGIIHVIDAVITPAAPPTLIEVAEADGSFTTLLTALDLAGLTATLEGSGPYTVFAPTDAAFAALDPAVLNALLADPNGALTDVLLHHVVSGNLDSGAVLASEALTMLSGYLTIPSLMGSAMIDGANIVVTDIEASNGTIHVIDVVLTPPGSIADIVTADPDFSTLLTALQLAGLDGTLAGPGPFTVFAPTDAAFAAVDPAVLNSLLADPAGALTDVLLYHVIGDELLASEVVASSSVSTLQGSSAPISVDGASVTIDGATIVMTNIPASNGIVHVIDAVLVP